MTKDRPKWTNLGTRPEDKCDELASTLMILLRAEKGLKVMRPDAIRIALEEAIARRARPEPPTPAG